MSAKFEKGDIVKAIEPVYEGNIPKKKAKPYEDGWVYARTNSVGRVTKVKNGEVTVWFKTSKTATKVKTSKLETLQNPPYEF